jgi:transposase
MNELHEKLAVSDRNLPPYVQRMVEALWPEVRDLEEHIAEVKTELTVIARLNPVVESLLRIPGLGLLTATTLFATIGDIHVFKSGRQLACWLGLTPRESSSGGRRRLGRISKQGDAYLRMLFIHGAVPH